MKSIYDSRQRLKFVFIFTAILIAIASLVVSDMLIKDLAQEERQKMEVWAEATRLTASKNTAVDLSLVLKILEGNTTIPVVLCNDKDSIMFVKNISFPENDVEEFKKVKELLNCTSDEAIADINFMYNILNKLKNIILEFS